MILALLTLSGTAFIGWLMAEPCRVAMLPGLPQIVAPDPSPRDRLPRHDRRPQTRS